MDTNSKNILQNNQGNNLFALYKDYRSGNKQALSGLYGQQKIHKCGEKEYIKMTIYDQMLSNMVYKALEIYQSPSKSLSNGDYKKFTNSHFIGDYDDMTMVFFREIQSIFDDNNFVPTDERMLYTEVKRRVTISVNTMLKNQNNSKDFFYINNIDENDNGSGDLLDWLDIPEEYQVQYQPIFCDYEIPKNRQYTSFVSDLLEFLKSVDLKSLLSKNAIFQRNLVDVLFCPDIVNYDDDGIEHIARNREIAKLYYKQFGIEPSEEQIVIGLNSIYKLLMRYYFGYVPVSRCDFEKSDGHFNVHTVISQNAKKDLLLSAIERFQYDFEGLGYNVDAEKIKGIAFENNASKNGKQRYWILKINNDIAIISEYYHKYNNYYSLIRNNDITINGIPDIYHIGNCVVIADDMEKQLYYYNDVFRLRLVSREGNLYKGVNLNNLSLNDLNIDEKDYKNISKSA